MRARAGRESKMNPGAEAPGLIKLHVYRGGEHPHKAQKPEVLSLN